MICFTNQVTTTKNVSRKKTVKLNQTVAKIKLYSLIDQVKRDNRGIIIFDQPVDGQKYSRWVLHGSLNGGSG